MGTRHSVLAMCIAVAVAWVWAMLPCTTEPAAAQTLRRAALIVQFGDGSHVSRCVSFTEESISGLELLSSSGLQVSLWGGAVCRIEQEGCDYPAQPCFCQCKGASCQYWSYWHWQDDEASPSTGRGNWTYAQVGSGDYRVYDGAVEAWLWGDAQTPPIAISYAEVCAPSASTAAATPGATASAPGSSVQSIPVAQYALFAAMVVALVAGFWLVRGRQRG